MSNRKLILIIILLITASIASYFIFVVVPTRLAQRTYDGAKQIGRDISSLFSFTPEITVNNTIVLQQQTPILELATVSQRFQHQYDWTNTRLGSTKKISITGGFEAKAGFDLHKKFSIRIDEERATIYMPRPQLLSVTPLDNITFKDEHGYWNWVNMDDRAKAMNAFNADAKKYATEAQFVEQARNNMEKELKKILESHGKTVEIRYEEGVRIVPM